jgi:hypothetical protein
MNNTYICICTVRFFCTLHSFCLCHYVYILYYNILCVTPKYYSYYAANREVRGQIYIY